MMLTSLKMSNDDDDDEDNKEESFSLSSSSSSFADNALTIAGSVQSLRGQIVVVNYGGNMMTSELLSVAFCKDVAKLQSLGVRFVVVHGRGPQIVSMLNRVGVESSFEGGVRVSSS